MIPPGGMVGAWGGAGGSTLVWGGALGVRLRKSCCWVVGWAEDWATA